MYCLITMKKNHVICNNILSKAWHVIIVKGPSWSWSYGSWIYSYLCNQCLSPLTLWAPILLRRGVLDTTLCDKVCQWLAAGLWFSLGTPISSKILLKMALDTITPSIRSNILKCTHYLFIPWAKHVLMNHVLSFFS